MGEIIKSTGDVQGKDWYKEVGSAKFERKEFRKKFYEKRTELIFDEDPGKVLRDPSKHGLKTLAELADAEDFSRQLPEKYEKFTGQTLYEFIRDYFMKMHGLDQAHAAKETALSLFYLSNYKGVNVDLTNSNDLLEIKDGKLYITRESGKVRLNGIALRLPERKSVTKRSKKRRAALKGEVDAGTGTAGGGGETLTPEGQKNLDPAAWKKQREETEKLRLEAEKPSPELEALFEKAENALAIVTKEFYVGGDNALTIRAYKINEKAKTIVSLNNNPQLREATVNDIKKAVPTLKTRLRDAAKHMAGVLVTTTTIDNNYNLPAGSRAAKEYRDRVQTPYARLIHAQNTISRQLEEAERLAGE